ncbi:hypothetical protein MTO96_031498 [Rhipicephalus appendiculatus]
MTPGKDDERRTARAKAMARKLEENPRVLYADASLRKHSDRAAVVVTTKDRLIVSASLRTTDPAVAEEAATKLRYRQQWKKTDPVLPAVPASLGLVGTAASLAGNLTGAGMVMIPFAFVWIGWSAIFWLPLFGVLAAFSASLLESCCQMLEERHEEYRRFHWYTQYSDIANRALGTGLAKVVSALRLLGVVGVWAVLIVIISAVLVDFLALVIPVTVPKGYMYCGMVVVCGVVCGVLNTPVALVLMILLLTGIADMKKTAAGTGGALHTINLFDLSSYLGVVNDQTKGAKDDMSVLYFVGLGVLAFNFAGVCGFTNIRRDMKAPPCFTKAAAFAVAGKLLRSDIRRSC